MQSQNSEDKPMEDMQMLRQILENLIKLSFDQENLITEVNTNPTSSPEFVNIVKFQKKISDDSQIIQDSLLALSKRVVEIQSTINKEINLINKNLKVATKNLEERNVPRGTEKQQFVMTSINNLALLLSEILEQMQRDLDLNSKCNKPKNCNKPKRW